MSIIWQTMKYEHFKLVTVSMFDMCRTPILLGHSQTHVGHATWHVHLFFIFYFLFHQTFWDMSRIPVSFLRISVAVAMVMAMSVCASMITKNRRQKEAKSEKVKPRVTYYKNFAICLTSQY